MNPNCPFFLRHPKGAELPAALVPQPPSAVSERSPRSGLGTANVLGSVFTKHALLSTAESHLASSEVQF